MSYDFSFDKKSIFFVLGGSVAIGALLFFAGFIVGWDRGTEEARLEFEKQNPATPVVAKVKTAGDGLASAPTKTKAATDSQSASAQEASTSHAPEQKSPVAPELKASPKPSPAKPSLEEPEKKPETQASANPASAGAETAAQKKPSPGAKVDDATGFSLQIGAFQNENNALRCESSLKSRGYAVFVFDTLDAAGHTWHTVRMGHYADMDKASAAATVFTSKERLPVFIRPVNEL